MISRGACKCKSGRSPTRNIARNVVFQRKNGVRYHIYNLIAGCVGGKFPKKRKSCKRCSIGDTGKQILTIRRTRKAAKKEAANTSSNASKYNERRWSIPSKRAKGYAEDRKAKVHTYGKKEGKELTDFEAGIRSGYLQCQGDHAGLYKYKKALAEGKSKSEAREISRKKSK